MADINEKLDKLRKTRQRLLVRVENQLMSIAHIEIKIHKMIIEAKAAKK